MGWAESSVMIGLGPQEPQPGQEHIAFPNKIGSGMKCNWGRSLTGWATKRSRGRLAKQTVPPKSHKVHRSSP